MTYFSIRISAMLVLSMLVTHKSFAQAPNTVSDNKTGIGLTISDYATVSGGWMLESRCKMLSPESRREFKWNVSQSTQKISTIIGRLPTEIQSAATKTAEKYECNDESHQIINAASEMAVRLSVSLKGTPWSQSAYNTERTLMMSDVILGDAVEQKCKIMPSNIHNEFQALLVSSAAGYESTASKNGLERLKKQISDTLKEHSFSCDDKAKFLMNAFMKAKLLSED